MWFISFRDLQFRQRRFLIAIVGTALVFAMSLIGSGMSSSFRSEAARTVASLGADAWLVADGSSGPFSTQSLIPDRIAKRVRSMKGVSDAGPILIMRQTLLRPEGPLDVNVIGFHRVGAPPLLDGRLPDAPGEAVADVTTQFALGAQIGVGPATAVVTGRTSGLTTNAGTPTVYARLKDVQRVALGGRPLASAVVIRGAPARPPRGFALLSNDQVRADLLRPLERAIGAIDLIRLLMWLVAASIVGAIIYLSALERIRDFAVLRAVGTSARALLAGLAFQAVVVSGVAAVLSIGFAAVLVPLFPIPVAVPAGAYAAMPAVAVVVGLVASTAGLRRAIGIDPAMAFGGP